MTVPFLLKTSERLLVASPYDTALVGCESVRRALLEHDFDQVAMELLPAGVATFEVRGLSPTEVRLLRPFLPPLDAAVGSAIKRASEGHALELAEARRVESYFTEIGITYLRLALEAVHGVAGWPADREPCLGRLLWPASTLDGLPNSTLEWLGGLAYALTALTTEKKRPSGTAPGGANGTTEAATSATAGVSG